MANNIGKYAEFTAIRIVKGNPVKGKIVAENEDSISVELSHDIEGMANVWEEGETRIFKKEFIHSLKITDNG